MSWDDGLILGLETASGVASVAALQMSDGTLVAELGFSAGRRVLAALRPDDHTQSSPRPAARLASNGTRQRRGFPCRQHQRRRDFY